MNQKVGFQYSLARSSKSFYFIMPYKINFKSQDPFKVDEYDLLYPGALASDLKFFSRITIFMRFLG